MTVRNTPLSGRRICVLTTGHLATSPRMTKAADAFAEAGAAVHVVSACSTPWAVAADRDIRRRRGDSWTWDTVDYRNGTALHFRSGLRQRSALALGLLVGAGRLPLQVAGYARERVFPEIAARAARSEADLIYGGGAGLVAAHRAAKSLGVPFGVDLEDFHTGDQADTRQGRFFQELSGKIEHNVLPNADLRTAGSEDIAHAYREKYGLSFLTVNNTFRLADTFSDPHRDNDTVDQPLRLYWFSQTIGPGRGLEDVIGAAGIAGIPAELHLQGVSAGSYSRSLVELAGVQAPTLRIVEHEPCMPDDMVAESAKYDVGLCLENPAIVNRDLCLSNKALAFVAAGRALVMTSTAGQRRLADELGEGAFVYESGDSAGLAEQLLMLSKDRSRLERARQATRAAAVRRWNWDDPCEKGALINAVAALFND